ncbi:acyl-CoA thioesterase [Alteromonas lipolytica]|uniref:Acyl-CoA thioesterase II n=1 Tax=Alteromonas lipolytica TaxID=1856405 RepID=A0A1E8FIJ8_9ALTE|nr:thioesterase family protein [Alteromonas lipolytica]OFI35762.1 acyl-CoA thioesterase II [Alteromonas lipolytica]GGF80548.1 hypothetical protein GCM10011338_36030 [Alteromonas lipolytica]
MHIDKLLEHTAAAVKSGDNQWTFSHPGLPDTWGQGRTAFGGITAAMLHHALSLVVEEDRSLRAYHTNFVGPVSFDTPIELVVEKLRAGRNMTQFLAKLVQNGDVCVCIQACFGVNRESKISIDKLPSHSMAVPQKPNYIPQIPKLMPRFFRYYDLAVEQGQFPFSWSKHSHYHGWMRFKEPLENFNYSHLISLIDAWPPAILQQLKLPAPASTVSWDIEMVQPLNITSDNPWFGYQVDTRLANDGYAHTEATIWDDKERVVALSRQTIAVFG